MAARVRRLRRVAEDLQPASWTALRVPRHGVVPPPSAFAAFGAGSWIVPPARISNPASIVVGTEVVLLENAFLTVGVSGPAHPLLRLGDRTRLARFNLITATVGVDIGEAVSSSDWAAIVDTWGPASSMTGRTLPAPEPAPVVIEAGAYLGAMSIVGPGVRVGEGAFVGEGAVVLEDVPAHSVVYGNPARVVPGRPDRATWEGARP